ncbi:MAG: YdeI/OmpD-associated family protein [Calditrichaeota bacterium]|nr:YdeI/OmpD-associated family protein [Calditrichota bacterium]
MPDFIQAELKKNRLNGAFSERPAYQQNDYLAWIKRAVRQETRDKRLQQMLTELKDGRVYMKMKWKNPTVTS